MTTWQFMPKVKILCDCDWPVLEQTRMVIAQRGLQLSRAVLPINPNPITYPQAMQCTSYRMGKVTHLAQTVNQASTISCHTRQALLGGLVCTSGMHMPDHGPAQVMRMPDHAGQLSWFDISLHVGRTWGPSERGIGFHGSTAGGLLVVEGPVHVMCVCVFATVCNHAGY